MWGRGWRLWRQQPRGLRVMVRRALPSHVGIAPTKAPASVGKACKVFGDLGGGRCQVCHALHHCPLPEASLITPFTASAHSRRVPKRPSSLPPHPARTCFRTASLNSDSTAWYSQSAE